MNNQSNKVTDYYYTNVLINNDSDNIIVGNYNTTQNVPILGEIQDFQMAVVRLRVPMSNVPLFLYESNKYFIAFGLSVPPNGPGDTANIISKTEVPYVDASDPLQPITGLANERPVYYYSDWLDMVNAALETVWNSAFTFPIYAVALAGLNQASVPYFRYVCDSGCIELVIPSRADGTSAFFPSNPTGIKILMTSALFNFFNGFPAYYYGEDGPSAIFAPTPPALTYHLNIRTDPKLQTNLPQMGTLPPGLYYCIKQDYSSISSFQQVARIILTTTIAVIKETILSESKEGLPQKLEVLTDLEVEATDNILKEDIIFNPAGKWRFHNFKDQGDLRRLDLRVLVQYNNLKIIPLTLLPGKHINCKLAFVRRLHNDLKQITDEDRATK